MSTLTKTCHMLYLNARKNNQLYLVLFAPHFVIDMSTLQVSGKDLNKLAFHLHVLQSENCISSLFILCGFGIGHFQT